MEYVHDVCHRRHPSPSLAAFAPLLASCRRLGIELGPYCEHLIYFSFSLFSYFSPFGTLCLCIRMCIYDVIRHIEYEVM